MRFTHQYKANGLYRIQLIREKSIMKFYSITLATVLITGCTYYQPAPVVYPVTVTTNKFDQSWSAAIGALADQGVYITTQNRGAGVVQGHRNGIDVTGNIHTQANGSVRVQFDTSGATNLDPTLIERITRSYNSRMGR